MNKAAISHHEAELEELRADPELAVEYLRAAMSTLEDPDDVLPGCLHCAQLPKPTVA